MFQGFDAAGHFDSNWTASRKLIIDLLGRLHVTFWGQKCETKLLMLFSSFLWLSFPYAFNMHNKNNAPLVFKRIGTYTFIFGILVESKIRFESVNISSSSQIVWYVVVERLQFDMKS